MNISNLSIPGAFEVKAPKQGPRALCFGAIHGNEPCGVEAITRIKNDFITGQRVLSRGSLVCVIANEQALAKNVRYVEANLNRLFVDDNLADNLHYEGRRAAELKKLICQSDFVLDLHSTSSPSEPFIICEEVSLLDARRLGALNIVIGWGKLNCETIAGDTENFALRHGVKGLTVECGSHLDAQAAEVAYQSIWRFLAYCGCSDEKILEIGPCKLFRLFHVEKLKDQTFRFRRQFRNLELIKRAEVIGQDSKQAYYAPCDCAIVLPSYRTNMCLGEEVYFLAELNELN